MFLKKLIDLAPFTLSPKSTTGVNFFNAQILEMGWNRKLKLGKFSIVRNTLFLVYILISIIFPKIGGYNLRVQLFSKMQIDLEH